MIYKKVLDGFILILVVFQVSSCSVAYSNAQTKLNNMNANDYFQTQIQAKLAQSIEHDDIASMEIIISGGADVDAIGRDGIRPLFWAILKNKVKSFRFLLEQGADPNFFMDDQDESLHKRRPSLMEFLAESEASEYLKLALRHNGNPNFVTESFYPDGRLSSRSTIIRSAVMRNRLENVRMLTHAGADVNYRDFSGATPMIVAASINNYDMVYFFLDEGADPTIKNKSGLDLRNIIEKYGSRGISPSSPQYAWYEKVVEKLWQ